MLIEVDAGTFMCIMSLYREVLNQGGWPTDVQHLQFTRFILQHPDYGCAFDIEMMRRHGMIETKKCVNVTSLDALSLECRSILQADDFSPLISKPFPPNTHVIIPELSPRAGEHFVINPTSSHSRMYSRGYISNHGYSDGATRNAIRWHNR